MSVHIDSDGLRKTETMFHKAGSFAPKGAERAVTKLAFSLIKEITNQFHQSGLQERTGAYLDSFKVPVIIVGPGGASSLVGTSSPYAARLEYGFMGIDAAGRHYADPPHPHWRPAILIVSRQAKKEVVDACISQPQVFK